MFVTYNIPTDLESTTWKIIDKLEPKPTFEVLCKLGGGTFGDVCFGVNLNNGDQVAIKIFKKGENKFNPTIFRKEIFMLKSIKHPHIVSVYEAFENKNEIVLVMPFAEKRDLYEYFWTKNVVAEEEVRKIIRHIVSALFYCHKNHICHRDLKLENILLNEHGDAIIGDFGLASVFHDNQKLYRYCGTEIYSSPEIIKAIPYCGPEVDCWSLGVILYTMVYRKMPFNADGEELHRIICHADYTEPQEKSSASTLIRKLLTVDPVKRATIADVCLDDWVNSGNKQPLIEFAMANLSPIKNKFFNSS